MDPMRVHGSVGAGGAHTACAPGSSVCLFKTGFLITTTLGAEQGENGGAKDGLIATRFASVRLRHTLATPHRARTASRAIGTKVCVGGWGWG